MNSNALALPDLADLKTPEAIFTEVRRHITKEHHSFSDAFYALQTKAVNDLPAVLTTDSIYLYYSPLQLSMFYHIEGFEAVLNAVLHLCSHCLLGHLPARKLVQKKEIFDVLADFKVQKMISILCNHTAARKGIKQLSLDHSTLPLKQAYQQLIKDKAAAKSYLRLAPHFQVDDHALWDIPYSETHDGDGNSLDGEDDQGEGDSQKSQTTKHSRITSEQREAMRNWAKMQRDFMNPNPSMWDCLASGSPQAGIGGASESWDYDYTLDSDTNYNRILEDFLKDTVTQLENLDEIDPMWYHFGLDYLGDIPIIEPTEEMDRPREGTLVLAVDTSGSCQMTVCDRFLAELDNMMNQLQLMKSYNQVVLMQCDESLHQVIEMESAEQWEQTVANFTLLGGGGTDFRPVFSAADQYEDMVGLIFLSDTMGTFPQNAPTYPTLFLVPDEGFCCDCSPPWVDCVSF